VAVPASATALRLRGYRCFATQEITATPWDTLVVTLQTTGGATLETLETWSNADGGAVCSWSDFTLTAASARAGQTVRLHLQGTTDFSNITSFWVDTLVLEAYACP